MCVKITAMFLLFGVCFALPVAETKPLDLVASTSQPAPSEPAPAPSEPAPATSEPAPVLVEDLSEPGKPDDSDLKSDATSWYHHGWYHHDYPIYRYPAYHHHGHAHFHAHW